jgi:RHS repeat-associated protein
MYRDLNNDMNRSLPVLLLDAKNRYVYGLGIEPLYHVSLSGNDPFPYHTDGVGSVRFTTYDDNLPEVEESVDGYSAFGNELDSGYFYDQPFMFAGAQKDHDDFASMPDSGLYYMRARYYYPVLGRFTSRDPYVGNIYDPLTLNRYTYVENNPVNKIDPSGHGSNRITQSCAKGVPMDIPSVLQPNQCIFPAIWPTSVNLEANIAEAKKWGWDPLWFANKVREGGIWDYKRMAAEYGDFGNFHYGVVGAAAGYSLPTLLKAAGVVQKLTNMYNYFRGYGVVQTQGSLFSEAPYGDDPLDQYWMTQGFLYYHSSLNN